MKKNFNDLLLSSLDKNHYTFISGDNANAASENIVFDSRLQKHSDNSR